MSVLSVSLGEVVGGHGEREPITWVWRLEPPAGFGGRDPGQGVSGRCKLFNVLTFLTVERPQEAANLPPLLYFAKSVHQRSLPRRSASIPYVSHAQIPKFLVTTASETVLLPVWRAALKRHYLFPLNFHKITITRSTFFSITKMQRKRCRLGTVIKRQLNFFV